MRGYALRSAAPVAGLATAVIVIGAGCAGIGAAVAGAGGAVIGVLIAAALTAAACAYCDRMALSAMLARPVSEVEHPELYRLVRELSKAGRLPVPRLYLSPAEQPNSFAVGRGPRSLPAPPLMHGTMFSPLRSERGWRWPTRSARLPRPLPPLAPRPNSSTR